MRSGKVSSSNAHQILTRRRKGKPLTESQQKNLNGNSQDISHLPAIIYGVRKEVEAIERIKIEMGQEHQDFVVKSVGAVTRDDFPSLIASPDLLVQVKKKNITYL